MKLRLGELTAAEASEALAARPVVLLPLGSYENQGPHAPMGDYLCAERIATLIAERASGRGVRTFAAPVLPFGGADFFGSVVGGIALSQATFRAVLTDIFACLLRHDVTRLIVLNGHGGNTQAIHDVTQAIWRERQVLIPSFYLWKIAKSLLPGVVGDDIAGRATGHGADPLTSIAMHLFPGLMRPDLTPAPAPPPHALGLPVSGFGTIRFEDVDIEVPLELAGITASGVFGADPRLASPESGKALTERLTELGTRFVLHVAAQTP